MPKPKLTISVVIVTYNSEKYIGSCLEALQQQSFKDLEIIVVDNNSKDTTLAILQRYPVTLIRTIKNVGFSSACNIAIRQSRGDYILLLNPDVYVQKDTLQKVFTYMQKQTSVGVLSCKLLYPNNLLQPSCRRYPVFLAHFIQPFFPRSRIVRNYLMLDIDHDKTQDVDWSIGAFLFIRRTAFDQIGLLDHHFFLYFEDIDLCQRAKKAGWRIVYYPSAIATHVYQRASYNLFSKTFFYHLKSMFIYYKKYGFRLL